MSITAGRPSVARDFVHEAFFYGSDADYLAGTVPFIEEGLREGEPVLVAVPSDRLELLQARFPTAGDGMLRFASMEEMGRNPAWIIPAWADFVSVATADGRPARGIGEPIWAARTPDEIVECERHEALLNVAFAGTNGFRLLCPYDTVGLPAAVVDGAHRTHPHLHHDGASAPSDAYDARIPDAIDSPLDPAPPTAEVMAFDARSVREARRLAADRALACGVPEARIDDLVVAVSEALTNSVLHGGGSGALTLWCEAGRFVCEVRDGGRLTDPLAGRRRPTVQQRSGRGLWIINQTCDLVQIRSTGDGLVVRLHMGV